MPVVHAYVPPERFVVGTVGQPGQRTFFLQARTGARVTSVALEKQQVLALAERIEQMLDDLLTLPQYRSTVPAVAPQHLVDSSPLEQPIVEEFRVGTMTLSWDEETSEAVLEIFPVDGGPAFVEIQDEDVASEPAPEALATHDFLDDDPEMDEDLASSLADALSDVLGEEEYEEMMLVRMPAGQARAFAARAQRVVEAGRPTCPFCNEAMDPSGHLCVRANGFRRRLS
ncbi:DUF3090 domain-containing protein [Nocardioides yefusunii]|uniref:DUF3090 domain-containing protein n=1 Tax=Nocardioides yefusunii TaxID=2500546 RepID=A0ABW1QW01_9ACTN|nr:DUF3090 domain-containing protein [Nocardioides yefusunii]